MAPAVGLRARAQIASFALERPNDAAAAAAAISGPGRTAMMGGGIDLIDRLKHAEPLDRLVALAGIARLNAIAFDNGTLSIGAGVTHAALTTSPLVAAHLPDLCRLWRQIANPRVRATGTIGGNLMAGQRHYDAAPAFLALGADAAVMMPDGAEARLSLADVAGRADVVLLAVRIPVRLRKSLTADRSLHPVVSVYCARDGAGGARLAVGCAYDRPVVIELPSADPVALAAAMSGLPDPIDDDLGSSGYRRRMVATLARRLLVGTSGAS